MKYMLQSSFVLLLSAILFSCGGLKTRTESPTKSPESKEAKVESVPQSPEAQPSATEPTPEVPLAKPQEIPRLGIIISGGGAKVLASIGVMKELQKFKIPVHSMAGIELGAFAAAVFAKNKLANEMEWQFSKLDPKDFHSQQNAEGLTKFLSQAWNQENVDSLKAPFACPSIHLGRQQFYVLSKGTVKQMLSYCSSYLPVFSPFDQSVAGLKAVKPLADHLRSRGANYVIFINVLSSSSRAPRAYVKNFESSENIAWVEASIAYKNPIGVDYALSVDTESYGIMNFDKRRELMTLGQEQAARLIQHLQQKFGL